MRKNSKLQVDSVLAFVTVAEEGSFSAAARKLKKSQPAVSVTVQNLESDLGYNLFDRIKNKPILTSKGKKLFHASKSLVDQYHALVSTADTLVQYENKKIQVGIDPLVYSQNCLSVLNHLSDQFSEIEIDVLQQPSSMLVQSLEMGSINVAFGFVSPECSMKFDFIDVSRMQCTWVCAPDYISQPSMTNQTLLLHNELTGYQPHHYSHYRVWKFDHIHAIIDLCLQGKGLTFLPEHFLSRYLDTGQLVKVEQHKQPMEKRLTTSLFWSHHKPLSLEETWLLEEFRKLKRI